MERIFGSLKACEQSPMMSLTSCYFMIDVLARSYAEYTKNTQNEQSNKISYRLTVIFKLFEFLQCFKANLFLILPGLSLVRFCEFENCGIEFMSSHIMIKNSLNLHGLSNISEI